MPAVPKKSTPKSILDRAVPITFDEDEPFSMGVFGATTTGKTTFWATFPKPILAVICSGGLKKPGELRSLSKEDRKGIKAIQLENCEELNELTEAAKDGEFKTIVLDHLTSFSDLCLMQILGLNEIPPQLSWGFASQQDWGRHGALVKEFIKNMIDLPKYTVIVSQQRWFDPPEKSGDEGVHVLGPAATPTIAGWLVPALDYCIQTFLRDQTIKKQVKIGDKFKTVESKTGKTEFCAYLPYSAHKMTKFRVPRGTKLEEVVVDPTFAKINALITGSHVK